MANIVPFNFENHEVRFNSLDEGSFEVAAADVARVLGYSDTTNLSALVDDEYKCTRQNTPGGFIVWLSEPGFYQGLARSNKPAAKSFQKWVYQEVLPTIRKTGSYSMKPISQSDLLDQMYLAHKEQRERVEALAQKTDLHDVQLEKHESTINSFLEAQRLAEEEFLKVPAPTESVAPLTTRMQINTLVNNHCGYPSSRGCYSNAFIHLYAQFEKREHVDLPTRAKNAGVTPVIEYAEQYGCIEKLYALAYELYGKN